MATPPVCRHCNTIPRVRRVNTRLPGTIAVDLALCDCDYVRCPAKTCRKPIRSTNVPHTCPHCNGRL